MAEDLTFGQILQISPKIIVSKMAKTDIATNHRNFGQTRNVCSKNLFEILAKNMKFQKYNFFLLLKIYALWSAITHLLFKIRAIVLVVRLASFGYLIRIYSTPHILGTNFEICGIC